MTYSLNPTGEWNRQFRKALAGAFDFGAIQLLTQDFFPDAPFAAHISTGFGSNFEVQLQEYINHAQRNDFLPALVFAAHARRPGNATLRELADGLGLTSLSPTRLSNPTGQSLEALVQAQAKFINLARFLERLPVLEACMCCVEVPGGGGTGFLVGPDLVLTNQHVVEPLLAKRTSPADVRCRFDFRLDLNGNAVVEAQQRPVALHDDAWLVDSRPPSAYDFTPNLGDASPQELDYALIRLAESVGNLPVGGDTADPAVRARGWIQVGDPVPALAAGNQIFILQHPERQPLQLAVGTVREFNGSGTRVRYDANTRFGSSGSPCFNADLELVALHHSRDPRASPAWNQGIPFGPIRACLAPLGVPLD
jgi:hypothetical protein